MMPRGNDYEQKRATARAEKLKALREEAKPHSRYAWVDKTKGIVRIPIERAMQLTVAELARKKPVPANPIAPDVPPAPAAAPAASPPAARDRQRPQSHEFL